MEAIEQLPPVKTQIHVLNRALPTNCKFFVGLSRPQTVQDAIAAAEAWASGKQYEQGVTPLRAGTIPASTFADTSTPMELDSMEA